MRLIFLFFIFFGVVLHSNAQNVQLEWAKSLGGNGDEEGRDIAVDANGNVYTTGSFEYTADFDPGPGVYNLVKTTWGAAMYISKLNANGEFQWAKAIYGTVVEIGYSITVDATGNLYITGCYNGTVDFDPGPGVFNLSGMGSIFVLKLDSSGNFIWAKGLMGSGSGTGNTILTDASGNCYIRFLYEGTIDADPGAGTYNLTGNNGQSIFICKLDNSGNFLWAGKLGGLGHYIGNSIALDASGNLYATGFFSGTEDFDPGPGVYNMTAVQPYDLYVSKFDPAGNFIWARKTEGINLQSGGSVGECITIDVNGNIIIGGTYSGTVDFDPGPGTAIHTSQSTYGGDCMVMKLDPLGNFLWVKVMGGENIDNLLSITTDAAGNIYSAGYYAYIADFDPGPAVLNLVSAGQTDVFVQKLNPLGGLIWVKSMGGPGYDWANGLERDNQGNIYLTGFYNNTADFDPGSGVYTLTSNGGKDAFVHKMTVNCATAGDPPLLSNDSASIVCPATKTNLSNLVISTAAPGISLKWYTNNTHSGTPYATPAAAASGTYFAFYYDPVNDCYSPSSVMVTVTSTPMIVPAFDTILPLCGGAPSPLPAISVNGINGTWVPSWNSNNTTTYTFIPAAGQCALSKTKMVTIKPVTYGTVQASVCEGSSYQFNGQQYTASNNTAKDTLINAAGCDSIITLNLTVVPVNPLTVNEQLEGCGSLRYKGQNYYADTVVSDTLLSRLGCDSVYNIATIKVYPQNPTIISIDTFACKRLTLNGVVYTKSVYVQDTIRTVHGCDSIIRHINIDIVNFDLDAVATVTNPYEDEFVYINTSSTGQSYEISKWQPTVLFADQTAYSNNFKALAPGMVNVLVAAVGRHNCADSVTIPIQVRPYDPKIILPNAFTPNGDGRNDVFMPQLSIDRAYTFLEFNVYNRWGQILYSTSNVNAGWDGSSKGVLQQQGVYYYTIKVRLLNNDVRSFSGELTLLK
ncbi:T9SS type B sorting domain-containing protein [Edaphocola aurantiacus]|uniref:T9SS type B sorting domain-containing protein n=1 Tax=Edaphocola aurantiacus TaxID=2601682 RepID=UPI001C943747|nr:gliding motility-associated C-terminal domain-containing protein [Edaphocola aurantiacus]